MKRIVFPIIALTSTAIPQVQNDIVNQLNMADPKIYRSSLDRKNLFYQIRPKKEMSRQYPRDLLSLKEINGVGEVKLEKYGKLFLERIRDYCQENNIKPKTGLAGQKAYSVVEIKKEHPVAYEKWTNEEEQKLINEYNNGRTISELSELLGRQPGGIRSRLRKLKVIL